MSEWISVKKELPEEGVCVLVSVEDLNGFDNIKHTVRVGKWTSTISGLDSRSHFWQIEGENGENAYRRITAWKPLDDPYVPEILHIEGTQTNKWISTDDGMPDNERNCMIAFYRKDDTNYTSTYAFAWFNHITQQWTELYSGVEYGDYVEIYAWAELPVGT